MGYLGIKRNKEARVTARWLKSLKSRELCKLQEEEVTQNPEAQPILTVGTTAKEGLSCGSWSQRGHLVSAVGDRRNREEGRSPKCPPLLPSSILPVSTIAHIQLEVRRHRQHTSPVTKTESRGRASHESECRAAAGLQSLVCILLSTLTCL